MIYKLEHTLKPNKVDTVHISRMKPYYQREESSDESASDESDSDTGHLNLNVPVLVNEITPKVNNPKVSESKELSAYEADTQPITCPGSDEIPIKESTRKGARSRKMPEKLASFQVYGLKKKQK